LRQIIDTQGEDALKRKGSPYIFCPYCRIYYFIIKDFPHCWNCHRLIDLTGYVTQEVFADRVVAQKATEASDV
jgi:hypothetical protein